MKKILFTLCLLSIIALPSQAQDYIIKNVNLISMTSNKVEKNKSVRIKDGKIITIGAFHKMYVKGIKIIDGTDQFLMPGLADMHVHLPEKENVAYLLKTSIAAGVTHVRLMYNAYSQLALKQDIAQEKISTSPRLHYSYLIKRDLKEASSSQMDSILDAVKNQGYDFIKLYSLASAEVFDQLMASAAKKNMIVCGHYPRYVQDKKWKFIDIEKVLQSKLRSIEHLGGYQSIQDDTKLLEAVQLTKKLGIFNCPTFDWALMKYHMQYPKAVKERLTNQCLPKRITATWDTAYTAIVEKFGGEEKLLETKAKRLAAIEKKKKVLKLLYENNCLLLVGSDADGPYQAVGFNIWEEMKNWSDMGIDNYTILKSATLNPAKFFKQEKQWGTVEVGKNADLILLDKNPLKDIENIASITTTIINGRVYAQEELMRKL